VYIQSAMKKQFYRFKCLTCKSTLNTSTIAKKARKARKHKEYLSTKQNMGFTSVIMQKNMTRLEI